MTDTRARTSYQSRGVWSVRDARVRVLALALTIAALVHGPLLPLRVFGWLRLLLRMSTEEPFTDDNRDVIIPIELDPDPAAPDEGAPPEPEPPPPATAPDAPAPTPGPIVVDAGVPAAASDGGLEDAGPSDAGDLDAGTELPDAGAIAPDAAVAVAQPDAGPDTPSGGKVRDPYAVAGDPGAVKPDNPNVRVYIAADQIRKHPVGPMFSELLAMIPEWSEVLAGTGVDPMRDFDHVLLSGPQFRDPSLIVAVMDFNIPPARMKQAIERAMRASSPPGEWLPGLGVETASLGTKGYRRAVFLADKRLFVLLPASAEAQVPRLKNIKPFRESDRQCLVLYLITPWRAFRGSGFKLPERIAWMRLAMTPVDTPAGAGAGGYLIEVEAQDESPEAAAEDAKLLSEAIEDVRVWDLWVKKVEVIGRPEFTVDGPMIRARAPVSIDQVERIIKQMKGWMKQRAKVEQRPAPSAAKRRTQPPGARSGRPAASMSRPRLRPAAPPGGASARPSP